MKKFLRILFILILIITGIFVLNNPTNTETNILKAVFSNNTADSTVVELSNRYSSKINVIIESSSAEIAEKKAQEFYNLIDKKTFGIEKFDSSKILETYKKYNKNLLSTYTRQKLIKKEYNEITSEAFTRLYNPVSFMLLPLNEDPYMLLEDYIQSLGKDNPDLINLNNKFYKIIMLEVNKSKALSPDLLNGEIKKLTKTQQELSDKNTTIYFTGTPIHSYYASSKAKTEINIICLLSLIFIIGLCYFYFRSLKLLAPIALSLAIGILSGYIAASIIFKSIHVLTFVFSTTLIGICIDYSLHYFIEKDLSKIIKSLTISMITTVSAFAVLLFSGVELLKQIAVFTMTGLFCVYLIVILYYPLINLNYNPRKINFVLPNKSKKFIATIIILTAVFGLFYHKFDDDIRNMYIPSRTLLKAENLFNELSGNNKKTTFAIVEGKNIEEILQKEENITEKLPTSNYQALSKFIPSKIKQKENFELRKELYKNTLKSYAPFLTENEINLLLTEKFSDKFIEVDNNLPLINDFLINKNTSVIVLYDIKNPDNIIKNGAKYIDIPKDISQRIKECRISCVKMIIPVFIILFIILSIIYKPKTALKIILPSILAATFSIGLLGILGQQINLFHILAIYLIIGFGLDYSVFRASCLEKVSDAVLLSCSTSVFSFFLLTFTSFKLINSLGFILTTGLIVSYLTSNLFNYENNRQEKKL